MSKIDKEIEKMEQMIQNLRKYGTEFPKKPTNRAELYELLGLSGAFTNLEEQYTQMQGNLSKLYADKRFTQEHKDEMKKQYQEAFIRDKANRLNRVKQGLEGYKQDLMKENQTERPDPVQLNNLLLQLAYIDTIDNNREMIAEFLKQNIQVDEIRQLVHMKHGNNAEIATAIEEYKIKANEPYKLIDEEINTINTLIANEKFMVNGDYIEAGITKFDPVDNIPKQKTKAQKEFERDYNKYVGQKEGAKVGKEA